MTSRSASRRPIVRARATLVVGVVVLVAGCATRSLAPPPPIVDRSTEPYVGAGASTADSRAQLYTVKPGETLYGLAKRFNTTVANLANWNNLGPDPRVKPGQVLRVNAPGEAGDANAASAAAATATTVPIGNETVETRPLGAPATGAPAAPAGNAPLKTGPLGSKRPYSDAAFAELSRPEAGVPSASTVDAVAPAAPVAPATPAATAPAGGIAWGWPSAEKVTEPFAAGRNNGIDFAGKAGDPVVAAADGKVTFSGSGVRGYGNFVIVRHTPELLSVYAHNRANLVKEGATVTKGQKIAEMGSSDSDAVKLHFEIRNDSKPVDPTRYLPPR